MYYRITVKETLTCHILWRPWQPGIDLKKPGYSFIPSPIITRMLNKTLSSPHRKSQFPWTLHGRSTNLPFQPTVISDHCHFVICRSNTCSAIRQCQWASQHTVFHSQTNTKYSHFPIRSLFHSVHNSPHFIVHIHRKNKIALLSSRRYLSHFYNMYISSSLDMGCHEPLLVVWTAVNMRNTLKRTKAMDMDTSVIHTCNKELNALESDSTNPYFWW